MKGSKICRASEYQGIFDRKRSEDRFNSTFILRNLSVEDSGSYICKVFGTGLHHHDTIEIVVSHSSNTHNILFIAVGVITGIYIYIYIYPFENGKLFSNLITEHEHECNVLRCNYSRPHHCNYVESVSS